MKTLKQLERLQKIHKLISQENTGTPNELATKIHISERELYRLLEYLKEIDAPIFFSHTSKSYYYTSSFDLIVNISVKVLLNGELKKIYGGTTSLSDNFKKTLLISSTDKFGQ